MSLINRIKAWFAGDDVPAKPVVAPIVIETKLVAQKRSKTAVPPPARSRSNKRRLTVAQINEIKDLEPGSFLIVHDETGGGSTKRLADCVKIQAHKAFGAGHYDVTATTRGTVFLHRKEVA